MIASLSRRQAIAGGLFVAPCLAMIAVFFFVPLAMTLWMSLHDWPLFGPRSFSGLANYVQLLQDASFWDSLWFTTRYTLLVTPALFIAAFILALVVQQPGRLSGLFRTAYFLPVVIGMSAASLLWVWLYNDQVGIFSAILMQLHLIDEPVQWFDSANSALLSIVAMVTWKMTGFTMVLLLVGMQAIPEDLYEAARIDGANRWHQLRYITLPLMRQTFALALTVSVIGSYLAFDQFYIMTHGGPQNSTIPVVFWIYRAAFTYSRVGYASAMSVVLLLILIVMSFVQLYLLRSDD
ncbi:carbohydrate ABC transporter permease [Amantichitinum ursilacus]|uniref:Lactose transport system permease protein LacF n=1 Tax=Amantichitinum ursilacus TaxID=857265 RepID=A0A0N0XKP7_9NEIS|nr:sugar ABC transporter permease [Amantichitinum ursilacus]KPC53429.1 Lactose transport system permease protein LacF [Amantichitinum ursilacus]